MLVHATILSIKIFCLKINTLWKIGAFDEIFKSDNRQACTRKYCKKMLSAGLAAKSTMEITGLNVEEVERLKKKIN